jgi:meiotic recombination protein REC8
VYIAVTAYGEDRFDLTFNPCNANIYSLCPMNSSNPIKAEAIIPVGQDDISNIPSIALVIPDFEGYAQLRFFSNTTQTEVACYQAVMRNGASFSHPAAVGSTLGAFAVIAIAASFATVIYGLSIPHVRTHYAHSLSVLVVMEVYQSIFFSGALSVNWPSVCAAYWSNFAWSAGMIYSPHIVNSVNKFVGQNLGNISQVGGAGSTTLNNNGGLQQSQQIYGRALNEDYKLSFATVKRKASLISNLYSRATVSATSNSTGVGYSWSGVPVKPGLPIPGNWSGFAGELSDVGIPASDAFLVGFLWLLILTVLIVTAAVAFKWILEGLSMAKLIKQDRLGLFRSHWLGFTGLIVLRILLMAFFMIMTLTLFQFSIGGNAGILAIAAIVWIIFFVGVMGCAAYACFFRLRFGKYASSPDKLHFRLKRVGKIFPWLSTVRESQMGERDKNQKFLGSLKIFRVEYIDRDVERLSVHDDESYVKRFGWLTGRFRRTRWWFFAYWVVYQFTRACFVGGARAHPKVQVYGLLVVEILALIAVVWINPFESSRNTALGVYMLSISKVATVGLSIAFLPQFNLPRIPAVVVGIIIIIEQSLLVIGTLILIILGAISSYMSLTRNQEQFRPHVWEGLRVKYFNHVENKAADLPPPPTPVPEEPKEPYFAVNTVLRAPKIEDEDDDFVTEMDDAMNSRHSLDPGRTRSRANSMRSTHSVYGNVPYGARVHRASWSSRDFSNLNLAQGDDIGRIESPFVKDRRSASAQHSRNNSAAKGPANLVKPRMSANSLVRPGTPTKTQQERISSQHLEERPE